TVKPSGTLCNSMAIKINTPSCGLTREATAIETPSKNVCTISALMVHTFFDGVSIAVASLVSPQLGVLIFIAILLHKVPEGFTVASMMLAAGRSHRSARISTLLVGLATLGGVALVLLFEN